ncbi:MAG: hypothetical protein AB7E85_01960 [Pseudobdellovibrionaceae bacterium]
MTQLFPDLQWWIGAIEVPLLTTLLWLYWREHQAREAAIAHLRDLLETRSSQLRESLAAFKLEVARSYAQSGDVKTLEERLSAHLLRIEAKLDSTALKTAELKASNHFTGE